MGRVKMNSGFFSMVCTCVLLILAACSNSEDYVAPENKGIDIANNSRFGTILTDDLGKTLYFFSNDSGTTSTCVNCCVDAWPIFYVSNPTVAAGLESKDFAEITRLDGKKQTTYKGWPLYYYVGDAKA